MSIYNFLLEENKKIEPIALEEIQTIFPEVIAPFPFRDLDKKEDMLKWLDSHKSYTGHEIENNFPIVGVI